MGWFDEQIRQRTQHDSDEVHNANLRLMSIVLGQKVLFDAVGDDPVQRAKAEIFRFYDVKSEKELHDRPVLLTGKWYEDAIGAFLGSKPNGDPIALIPQKMGGYAYFDYTSRQLVRVSAGTPVKEEAVSFYKRLPEQSISVRGLFAFMWEQIGMRDWLALMGMSLLVVLIGALLPYINDVIFSKVIVSRDLMLFAGIGVLLFSSLFAQSLISICRSFSIARIEMKLQMSLYPAIFGRLLSLPAHFFRSYSSGDLARRIYGVPELCSLLVKSLLATLVSVVLSSVYLFQIEQYTPSLFYPTLGMLGLILVFDVISTSVSVVVNQRRMEASVKLFGFLFAVINGIQKIKQTGSEKRMYTRWANLYGEKAAYEYNPPLIMKINGPVIGAISMLSMLVFFYVASRNQVTVAEYMAFAAAFGMLASMLNTIHNVIESIAYIRPTLDLLKPILEATPEPFADKEEVRALSGNIEIRQLTFKYKQSKNEVLKDLSIRIPAGEYVAIVGKTGCGKSTLIRLLLGFEKPQGGTVLYDGMPLERLDVRSLRKKIGTVLQNDKLFASDIATNIRIANPLLSLDEVWEAARLAQIDKEIEQLPMGMFTHISEGGGGFSGGQKQRMMIARAVAGKPNILIFDEATSSLDNITQAGVAKALDDQKCTRIVIAHRLSTIRNCDRILVIDKGCIVEEGTYDELMDRRGFFEELVKNQL